MGLLFFVSHCAKILHALFLILKVTPRAVGIIIPILLNNIHIERK